MVFALVGLVLTQAGWMPPLRLDPETERTMEQFSWRIARPKPAPEPLEEAPPPPREVSTCTPTGLFTANGDTVSLQRICIRIFRSPDQPPRQSLWRGAPLVITKQNGIYKLPFQNVHLVREGQGFDLVIQAGEHRVHVRLEANSDGVFSFEDAIDRLKEVLD